MSRNDWMLRLLAPWVDKDVCERRHGGNEQSREAFKSVRQRLTEAQERIYNAIWRCGEDGSTMACLSAAVYIWIIL